MNNSVKYFLAHFQNDKDESLEYLKDEYTHLEGVLEKLDSAANGDFKRQTRHQTGLDHFIESIKKNKRNAFILHISGHNGQHYQYWDGNILKHETLESILSSCENLFMLFLNGCSTNEIVNLEKIREIPVVIYTTVPIYDIIAYNFSKTFYDELKIKFNSKLLYGNLESRIEYVKYCFDEAIKFNKHRYDNLGEEHPRRGNLRLNNTIRDDYKIHTIEPSSNITQQIQSHVENVEIQLTVPFYKKYPIFFYDILKDLLSKEEYKEQSLIRYKRIEELFFRSFNFVRILILGCLWELAIKERQIVCEQCEQNQNVIKNIRLEITRDWNHLNFKRHSFKELGNKIRMIQRILEILPDNSRDRNFAVELCEFTYNYQIILNNYEILFFENRNNFELADQFLLEFVHNSTFLRRLSLESISNISLFNYNYQNQVDWIYNRNYFSKDSNKFLDVIKTSAGLEYDTHEELKQEKVFNHSVLLACDNRYEINLTPILIYVEFPESLIDKTNKYKYDICFLSQYEPENRSGRYTSVVSQEIYTLRDGHLINNNQELKLHDIITKYLDHAINILHQI